MPQPNKNEDLQRYIDRVWNDQNVKQAYPRSEDRRQALEHNYRILHEDKAEPAPSATGPITLASLKGEADVTGETGAIGSDQADADANAQRTRHEADAGKAQLSDDVDDQAPDDYAGDQDDPITAE